MREEKAYQECGMTWEEFCPAYLKICWSEAARIIRLWQEFGAGYFEIAQLTRISPETYRAIASSVKDGRLLHNGESIALDSEKLLALDKLCDSSSESFAASPAKKHNEVDRIGPSCVLYWLHDALADLTLQHRLA
jgi:hypothetical protein